MRVTFYVRVSTNLEIQEKSITNQIDYFKAYIEKNNLTSVVGCGQLSRKDGTDEATDGYYVDEGLSASKSDTSNRRAFEQMIKDAEAGKFDMIFVKSISRLSRNTKVTLETIDRLKLAGVGIYIDDIGLTSLDSKNDMFITFFAGAAQEESRQKSESIHFGVKRGMINKKWTSSPPYGYNKIKGYLHINEDEAVIVKQIFDWYLNDGIGIKIITRRLIELKVPTKYQRKSKRTGETSTWSHSTIKNILNNPIYTGRMIQNRTRKVDIALDIVEYNSPDKYIKHDLEHLRVIDDKTYQMVQAEKDERMKKIGTYEHLTRTRDYDDDGLYTQKVRLQPKGRTSRHSGVHLFSNLFYCGNCGVAMRRRKNYYIRTRNKQISLDSLEYHYVCSTYDLIGKHECAHRNLIYESKLLKVVKEQLAEQQKRNLSSYLKMVMEANYDLKETEEAIVMLQAEVTKLKNRKSVYIDMRADGEITKEEYEEKTKEIDKVLKVNREELLKKENIQLEIDKLNERYNEFINTLKGINDENISNPLLKKVIDSIKITKYEFPWNEEINPSLRINWKFMDRKEDEIDNDDVIRIQKQLYEEMTDEEKKEYDALINDIEDDQNDGLD